MESYGLTFRHNLVVEHVLVRKPWTKIDQGRIIYDRSTRRCYVGQLNDWAMLGVYEYMIKDNHIFTDDLLSGSDSAILAIRIPMQFSSTAHSLFDEIIDSYSSGKSFTSYDTTSNVQFALDSILHFTSNLNIEFDAAAITSLNCEGITADGITYDPTNTVQDILGKLKNLRADEVELSDTSVFGLTLGFVPHNVDVALIDIAIYSTTCEANQIPIDVFTIDHTTTVQWVINDIYIRTTDSKFIELLDGPDEYDENQLVAIHTNGRDSCLWEQPIAGNLHIKFPNIFNIVDDTYDDIIITQKYFHPSDICCYECPEFEDPVLGELLPGVPVPGFKSSVKNTVDFSKLTFTPSDFYSTSVQQGVELVKEIICGHTPRALACSSMLIVNSESELIRVKAFEQHKDDAGCNVFCDATVENITTDCYKYIARSNGCEMVTTSDPIAQMKIDLSAEDTICFAGCYDSPKIGSNLLSLSDAFANWPRYADSGNDPNVWTFTAGSIHSTYNFQYYAYFYSPDSYDKYQFELTVRSSDPDDDYICLVAAHGDNSNITVMRTKGGGNGGPARWPTYCVVYNFNIPGERLIGTAVGVEAGGGGWDGDFSRLFVCRYEDKLTIACSPFGSETISETSQVTIDLADYPSVSGPRPVGFGGASQPDAWFSTPSLFISGPPNPSSVPIPDIYDVSEQTRWCWVSGDPDTKCYWEPIYVDISCGGNVAQKIPCSDLSPTSCSQLDSEARRIYDISTDNMYDWNRDDCIWELVECPTWSEFERNVIYYNDITCRIFYFNCDKQWSTLN